MKHYALANMGGHHGQPSIVLHWELRTTTTTFQPINRRKGHLLALWLVLLLTNAHLNLPIKTSRTPVPIYRSNIKHPQTCSSWFISRFVLHKVYPFDRCKIQIYIARKNLHFSFCVSFVNFLYISVRIPWTKLATPARRGSLNYHVAITRRLLRGKTVFSVVIFSEGTHNSSHSLD